MADDFFSPLYADENAKVYRYYTGEAWEISRSGKTLDIISPIDQHVTGKIQAVTSEEADIVINRAKKAQLTWERTPLHDRVKMMHMASDWIRHYAEIFTDCLVEEIGKSKQESRSEVVRTADLIDYVADEVQSITGQELDSDNFPGFDKGRIALVERVAHGVVLAIAPFNYPVNLAASKFAPALLMGNTVIFKPPTQGSISGLLLTQSFVKAGLPPGVFSTITGSGKEIGDHLVRHPEINMIAFTGSSETGKGIATKAGMKMLLFECGGNNPVLILQDADMSLTATEIVKGGLSYAGQRCTGIKYVLAQQAVLDVLIPEVIKKTQELVHMGDPRDDTTQLVGPVISLSAAELVQTAIDESVSQGASIVMGGKHNGTYVEPAILKNVRREMRVVAEEIFGPVISFVSVMDMNEAVRIVNESRYGLQASIFTRDEGAGMVLAKKLNVGTVQVNGSPQRGPDHFPFMGVKDSGLGVQGVRYSLEAMSRLKSTVINKPQ